MNIKILFSVLMFLSGPIVAQEKTAHEYHMEALREQAEYMAKARGVPTEDVWRQLKLQDAARSVTSDLREKFKDRMAGIYIEHEPIDRLVVRLKGDAKVANRKLEVDGDVLLIEFIVGQDYTHDELNEIMSKNHHQLMEAIQDIQGMFADEKEGNIVIDVYMKEKDDLKLEEMRVNGENILGVPVRIHWLPAKFRDLRKVQLD